jgi:hypothetical protein
MRSFTRASLLLLPTIMLLLAACASKTSWPVESPLLTAVVSTHLRAMPPTYTPTSTLTPMPATITPAPSSTPTLEPTIAATEITPFVKGPSLGAYAWSPDSRWLPYVNFTSHTLYFYDVKTSTTCGFSAPISNPVPNHFLAWLPDGRVVVQTADKAMAGLPCGKFALTTDHETTILDHQDASYSPDGHYQVVVQPYKEGDPAVNTVIDLKDVTSGKNLVEINVFILPGGSSLPGYWLDSSHFLIPVNADQGPLLLSPGKPPVRIAADFFKLPIKPGNGTYDNWLARSVVSKNPPRFHLMLLGLATSAVTNPLQIYHSETGRVETLPHQAVQGAFTNDGHWLLIGEVKGKSSPRAWIRPLDSSGAPLELFTDRIDMSYTWSPDGSQMIGMSNMDNSQSLISLYSSPKRAFLAAWRATDYKMSPYWSPDGKYLAAFARSYADAGQTALFLIRVPGR